MDLTGFNAAEKAALSDDLSEMLSVNPRIHQFLNKVTYSQGVDGLNYVFSPGLEGIDIGQGLQTGDDVSFNDVKMREKTVKLVPWNKAYGLDENDIQDMVKGGPINQRLLSNMSKAIPWTFYAAFLEFCAGDPGKYGVLPDSYDVTTPDEQNLFSNSGYLDNLVTRTGWGLGDIKNDLNQLLAQLLDAKLPQSNIRYWEGINLVDLEMVVIFPPLESGGDQIIQQFRAAFEAPDMLHTIGGTIYNASGTNLEAKMNITLIPSGMWRDVFGDAWGVFLIPKDRDVKYAPVIGFHNKSGRVGNYENVVNGMNFSLEKDAGLNMKETVGIFSIATLGPGTTFYESKRKWGHSNNGYMGFNGNRFLCGLVQ